MENKVTSTYKSGETEEWLDKVWTRPIGYLWAVFFKALNVHPNAVTVLSMIIGASSALLFFHGSYFYEGVHGLWMNIAAILMLMCANFLDSADGQLARMTGKKTQLGRILDGAASEVWFIPIYLALVARMYQHHSAEFASLGITDSHFNSLLFTAVVFVCVLYSGFKSHAGQCALADYYRQIHLLFLKGEKGSELDGSEQLQRTYDITPWKGNFIWKAFLKTYINYTANQEKRTPCFQLLYSLLLKRYGCVANVPETIRTRFRSESLPLIKFTNILTFNTRAIMLYTCCIADIPWAYFIFEIVFMGLLCLYMNRVHERFCLKLMDEVLDGSLGGQASLPA